MSSLERLELLFAPIYWFLMAVGYVHFFLCMLPAMGLAFLLGRYNALVFLPRWIPEGRPQGRPGYRKFLRFYGWRRTLAALAWDAAALALSVFLGRFNGWWILFVPKWRRLGGLLGAGCFLLGHLFPAGFHKNKEV